MHRASFTILVGRRACTASKVKRPTAYRYLLPPLMNSSLLFYLRKTCTWSTSTSKVHSLCGYTPPAGLNTSINCCTEKVGWISMRLSLFWGTCHRTHFDPRKSNLFRQANEWLKSETVTNGCCCVFRGAPPDTPLRETPGPLAECDQRGHRRKGQARAVPVLTHRKSTHHL